MSKEPIHELAASTQDMLRKHIAEFDDYRQEATMHFETSRATNARVEAMHVGMNQVVPDLKRMADAVVAVKEGLVSQNGQLVTSASSNSRMPTSIGIATILILGMCLVIILIKHTGIDFEITAHGIKVRSSMEKPSNEPQR